VPILVVPGQRDDLIIGTNVIKFLAHRMKGSSDFWRLVSDHRAEPMAGCEQFLDVMANTCRWKGSELPDKVGTIKLQQCVTLLARQEHLVWGKLPKKCPNVSREHSRGGTHKFKVCVTRHYGWTSCHAIMG